MREKLNDNPAAQIAVIGILLAAVGIFAMTSMGGGSEEEEGAAPPAAAIASTEVSPSELSLPASGPGAPPPPPRAVLDAFAANQTVALLFVDNGGIDDRLVAATTRRLDSLPRVASFVVPASQIAHYAGIAQGVKLSRVPALVVLRPKQLDGGAPAASVEYGFQSPQSVVQAVIDARYHGQTLGYHP